ncbi:MAG: response regulator transcription factor [Anaerolineae bacterium]|nr:response regulator transcription factor [Anaerolineae bacterium]
MSPTRVLIIDDHDPVREALRDSLQAIPGIEIVGCTGDWRDGLHATLTLKPDVVLLETKRADGEGLTALQRLTEACPFASIVVLTSYPDLEEQMAALRMGIARYLLKNIDTPQLVREIQAVVRPQAMV